MKRLGLAIAVVAAVGITACKRTPAVVTITRLLLNLPSDLESDHDLREGIRNDIATTLSQDTNTRFKPDEREGTHTLRVEVAAPLPAELRNHRPDDGDDDEPGNERVRVELRPRPDALSYDVIGEAQSTGDFRRNVQSAFADAWSVITTMRLLDRGDDQDLIGALKSDDQRVQLFAVGRLGDHKSKAAVEPLIGLLTEESRPELALRSIGALIAIGDPRAAGPMIELAHNKDPQFVLQVVFALGSLGGPTAEGYLVTLASGHPVEAVRRGAEDALAEMARKHK